MLSLKESNFETEIPLVSIVCNAFNHADFIVETIEGFLSQKTDFGVEILIHDDASKDKTDKIISSYASNYNFIKPILQDVNIYSQGKKARNLQYPRARGKYLALCEGDDFWTDELKLYKQVMVLESLEDISLSFHLVNSVGNIEYAYPVPHKSILSFRDLAFCHYVPTCSMLFRRESLDLSKLRKFDKVSIGDIPTQLLLLNTGKAYCHLELMGTYRKHAGGITQNLGHLRSGRKTYIKCYFILLLNVNYKYAWILLALLIKNLIGLGFDWIIKRRLK